MNHLVVLGAGTAGTMVVNKLARELELGQWDITVVDQDLEHHYQPGYLFVPFGTYTRGDVVRPRRDYIPDRVHFVVGEVDVIDTEAREVRLTAGRALPYDQLVIATGTTPRPDQTEGMLGKLWRDRVFDFYTLDGAVALNEALNRFDGGRLVVHVTEMPIKCPVAPLEFTFLVESMLRERGLRERTELVYVTPLDGAFTKPVASKLLGDKLAEHGVIVETDFMIEHVDNDDPAIVSYDERRIPFDLLVTVPLNMGADFVGRSGLGDELNYVRVDQSTLQSVDHDNIFAIGDASNIPASKAGSVAHFAAEVFVDNFLDHIQGKPMRHAFDGHANCFVETGDGRGMLIDFNYDTQPLPGRYPIPGVGPFKLLEESRLNHLGKLAFKPIYWNVLLRGRPVPLPTRMTMAGKISEEDVLTP